MIFNYSVVNIVTDSLYETGQSLLCNRFCTLYRPVNKISMTLLTHVGPTRLVAGAVELFEFAMCAFTRFYVNFSTCTYTSVKRGINKPRPNNELSGLIHRNYLSLVNSTKSYLVQLKNLLQVNKSDQISFPYLNQITRICRVGLYIASRPM